MGGRTMNCKYIIAVGTVLFSLSTQAAELVVIGHPSATTLTKEQLADMYLGKNMGPALLDLPESSPARAEFYHRATGRDLAQIKSTWSRLTFTGKGLPPKEMPDAAAVKKAVAADPKAVGYIEKSAMDGSVKALLSIE
jgi:ABC-type phosphate transport system substrate-binding protein